MFFVCYFYPPSIPGRYQGIFKGATITTAGKRATQKVVTRFEMRSLILNMSMGFVRKTKKKNRESRVFSTHNLIVHLEFMLDLYSRWFKENILCSINCLQDSGFKNPRKGYDRWVHPNLTFPSAKAINNTTCYLLNLILSLSQL